jgi:hypothetical protein
MIINSSKVKSEALLLFCRELILSYEKSDDDLFDISTEIKTFIDEQTKQLNRAINVVIQPNDYYMRNTRVTRIAIIIKTYEFLSSTISKKLAKGDVFNPAMLCFALLSTWFAELSITEEDKEFLYFNIYPYSEIYDKLLLNIDQIQYKQLNIKMLQIAEDTIFKLNTYRFK